VSFGGYLLDEHIPAALADALRREDPSVELRLIGSDAAPPRGAPDPDLLVWLEKHDFMLVTDNRGSMPVHLREHLAAGRHVRGILTVRKELPDVRAVVADLVLIWQAGRLEDFYDRIGYLPLR
jgi:hypothetical protein